MNGFKKIGENIKFYRERKGLSQIDIAKTLKISCDRFRKIENGEVIYQMSTLEKIAGILGVELPDLLNF